MKEEPIIKEITATGVEVNYYFICKRKLWLFAHNIQMEHNSEAVEMGSLLHENSYKRKRREISLGSIKLDFIEPSKGLIHEVKKSRAIEAAHIWQLKYYLYRLKCLGLYFQGKIDYPTIRRTEDIILSDDDEKEIENILKEISDIKNSDKPVKAESKGICKKCSYYEFCFV